jgi:hypothetical protein
MKQDFDNNLKQRLGEASLPEAGVRFDKDKLWAKIEKKKTKKSIKFLPWVSHAAAVAAGLVIGIFFFTREHKAETTTPAVVVKQDRPAAATITDTVYVVKHDAQTQKNEKKVVPVIRLQEQQKWEPEPIVVKETLLQTEKQNLTEPVPEQVLAVTQTKRVKVLHLSDIDNENANPKAWERKKTFFEMAQSNNMQSDTHSETISMLVAKKLNLTKN